MNILSIASRLFRKLTKDKVIPSYNINEWMNMTKEDRNSMDKLYKLENKNKKSVLLQKIRNEYKKIASKK